MITLYGGTGAVQTLLAQAQELLLSDMGRGHDPRKKRPAITRSPKLGSGCEARAGVGNQLPQSTVFLKEPPTDTSKDAEARKLREGSLLKYKQVVNSLAP